MLSKLETTPGTKPAEVNREVVSVRLEAAAATVAANIVQNIEDESIITEKAQASTTDDGLALIGSVACPRDSYTNSPAAN